MGRVDNARIRRTAIRNAQFVSFVDASGCFDRRQPDRFDRRLRRLKLIKGVLSLAAAGWLIKPLGTPLRLLALAAGVALIIPHTGYQLAGGVLVGAIIALEWVRSRRQPHKA